MNRLLPLVFLAACGPSGKSTEIPKSNKPLTPKDIVQRSSPAIVRVEATGDDGEQFGTGFIVDKTGVVATNFHVIQGLSDIKIKLQDGSHYTVQSVLNVDPGRDLAIMKFQPDKPMPSLRLGDSNKVAAGEKIVAIGNPLGVFENTVSEGLISSIRQICSQQDAANKNPQCPIELHLLQISAPISQGSSGGPLFNQTGEVVGITAAIITQGQLINFAVPANYLKPLLAQQQPISLDEFAKATKREGEGSGGNGGHLPKKPPEPEYERIGFAADVYAACTPDQIDDISKDIAQAIDLGAPLYNAGNIEACFRIYEGLATKIEHDSACKGARRVFGDVLLQSQSSQSFAEKAWFMRYTFDGWVKGAQKLAKKP